VNELAIGLGDKHLDGCEESRGCCRWLVVGDREEVHDGQSILVDECGGPCTVSVIVSVAR
jgi:hypothetical protein